MGISVVVPAYNSEQFLAATLQSVRAQTRADWELVVVNDGSTDRTGAVAEALAALDERIKVVHQENAGISNARNRGFAATRKDYAYCVFLDHDDLLEPDALEMLVEALEKDKDAVGAHGLARFIDSAGQPILGSYVYPGRRRSIRGKLLRRGSVIAPTTFEMLAYANFIVTSGLMMRRAKKLAAGDFDPRLVVGEDWDMWLRLSRLGHIAFVNQVVYARRRHANNFSRRSQLVREYEVLVRRKLLASPELSDYEKGVLRVGQRYYELHRARVSLMYAVSELIRGRLRHSFTQARQAGRHILTALRGD